MILLLYSFNLWQSDENDNSVGRRHEYRKPAMQRHTHMHSHTLTLDCSHTHTHTHTHTNWILEKC